MLTAPSGIDLRLFLFWVTLWGSWVGCLTGQEIKREAPPVYTEFLAPHLTSFDQAINAENPYAADDYGVVLLNEQVRYLADDGRYFRLYHYIIKATSEAGAKQISEDTYRFRFGEQTPYLVTAETILPSGEKKAVRDNAIIVRSLQEDRGASLYDNSREIVIVFPDVEEGCITRSIFITEEKNFRVPKEFMNQSVWDGRWPRVNKILKIDLPGEVSERLSFSSTGTSLTPVKQELEEGRVLHTYNGGHSPRTQWEIGEAPGDQIGPVTRVSTWKNWDEMAIWYDELLAGRAVLDEDLAAEVDGWTKDLNGQDEVVKILFEKAASEVRYTGLEFGISGLQPYDCNDVWENRYGDCKDKANLLKGMLTHCGIESHITLLQTRHAGLTGRETPHYGQFNHAILAVRPTGGGDDWLFCDPTIEGGQPGALSPSCGGRAVLIVNNKKAEWAKTPDVDAGELLNTFELDLEASGELSGWFTLQATGYYAISYGSWLDERQGDSRRQALQDLADDYIQGGQVIDTEEAEVVDGKLTVRCFLDFPRLPAPDASNGGVAFPAPLLDSLAPNYGDSPERRTPLFQWRDDTQLTIRVALPEGTSASRFPEPFVAEGSGFLGEGRWLQDDDGLLGEFRGKVKTSQVKPEDFAANFQAARSFLAWARQPLILAPGDAPPAQNGSDIVMPIMPTGEGQINLVNSRFPINGDLDRREAALRRVLQYFPEDTSTIYDAGIHLAYLDYLREDPAEAAKAMAELNKLHRTRIDADSFGWGRYLEGIALIEDERANEAVPLFAEVFENKEIDSTRRSWAVYQIATHAEDMPLEEIRILLEKALEEETPARGDLYVRLLENLHRSEDQDEIETLLRKLAEGKDADARDIAAEIIYYCENPGPLGDQEIATALRPQLSSTGLLAAPFIDEELQGQIRLLQASEVLAGVSGDLQKEVKAILEGELPPYFLELESNEEWRDADDSDVHLEAIEDDGKNDHFFTGVLDYLATSPPSHRFGHLLWRASVFADFYESKIEVEEDLAIYAKLASIGEKLPKTDENYLECRLFHGLHLRRRGLHKESAEVYEMLLAEPDFDEEFGTSARSRLGFAREKMGDWAGALEIYKVVEKDCPGINGASDATFRACYIHLQQGNVDEAMRLLGLFSKEPDERLNCLSQLNELIAFRDDPDALHAYWEASAQWWPEWERLAVALVPEFDFSGTHDLPVLEDSDGLYSQIGAFAERKDREAFIGAMHQLAGAARWDPYHLNQLSNAIIYLLPQFHGGDHAEWLRFLVKSYDGYQAGDPENLPYAHLAQIIALANLEESEAGLDVVKLWQDSDPSMERSVDHALLRVWGIMALSVEGEDLQPVQASMEELLASNIAVGDRNSTVEGLGNIYVRQKDYASAESLLRKELENPRVTYGDAEREAMKSRLDSIVTGVSGGEELTAALDRWLTTWAPAWWERANPQSIDGVPPKALNQMLDNGRGDLSSWEGLKFQFLVARDSDLPLGQRSSILFNFFNQLSEMLGNVDEGGDLIRLFLENEKAPEDARFQAGLALASIGITNRLPAIVDEAAATPAFVARKDVMKERTALFKSVAEPSVDDREAIMAVYDEMASEEMDSSKISFLSSLQGNLVLLGPDAIPDLERIRSSVGQWKLASGLNQTSTALKLQFLKQVKAARKLHAINEEIISIVKEVIPPPSEKHQSRIRHLLMGQEPESYSAEEILASHADMLHKGLCWGYAADDWLSFLEAYHGTAPEGGVGILLDVIELLIESAETDLDRSHYILRYVFDTDIDDPQVRENILSVLESYRTISDQPLTMAAIRFYDLKVASRTGEKPDMAGLLPHIQHPVVQYLASDLILQHSLLSNDDEALALALENSLGGSTLDNTSTIINCLIAARRLGLEDESELLEEEARNHRQRSLIDSWAGGDAHEGVRVIELTELLGDSEAIPDAWIADVLNRCQRSLGRESLESSWAVFAEDWERAAKVSEEAIQRFPTFYHFYWKSGLAHHKLGKTQKATERLETYLQYAHDELEHLDAKAVLQEIKANP